MLYFNSFPKSNDTTECFIAQIFVFKDEECLGWDCFSNDIVTVGSAHQVDIRLDDLNAASIHAIIYFKEDQIIVASQSPENPILVNGKVVGSCTLQTSDIISIGSHTLKIKLLRISDRSQSIDQNKGMDKTGEIDANIQEITRINECENLCWNWVEEDD